MEENNEKKKKRWLIILIFFLLFSVVVSTIVYVNKLKDYLPNDDGAIDIVEPNNNDNNSDNKEDEFVAQPGFQVSDENGVWSKKTTIQIFKISYENGDANITIAGLDGDKVIAPGSENTYKFKLKNTGNVAMKYNLNIDAYITPSEVSVPVESKLSRFDGKWISGDSSTWIDVDTLDQAKDTYTLGRGRFIEYELDWRWLFESGDDEFDTYLGNLAVEEDIVLTLVIETVATVSDGSSNIGGILAATGDNSQPYLYMAVGGLALLVFLVLLYKKDEE